MILHCGWYFSIDENLLGEGKESPPEISFNKGIFIFESSVSSFITTRRLNLSS
jgi:hypothetical protein